MRYRYDNSPANVRNPNHPPRAVESGNQSTDEMAHLWLQVLPEGAGDRRLELQEAVMRHRLAKHPDDFSARFNLSAVLLARLHAPEAVGVLEEALRIEPENAEAHNAISSTTSVRARTISRASCILRMCWGWSGKVCPLETYRVELRGLKYG